MGGLEIGQAPADTMGIRNPSRYRWYDYGKILAAPYIETFEIIMKRDKDNQEWGDALSGLIENPGLAEELPRDLYLKIKNIHDDFWGAR